MIDRLDAGSPEVQRFLAELAALPETTTAAEPSPSWPRCCAGCRRFAPGAGHDRPTAGWWRRWLPSPSWSVPSAPGWAARPTSCRARSRRDRRLLRAPPAVPRAALLRRRPRQRPRRREAGAADGPPARACCAAVLRNRAAHPRRASPTGSPAATPRAPGRRTRLRPRTPTAAGTPTAAATPAPSASVSPSPVAPSEAPATSPGTDAPPAPRTRPRTPTRAVSRGPSTRPRRGSPRRADPPGWDDGA